MNSIKYLVNVGLLILGVACAQHEGAPGEELGGEAQASQSEPAVEDVLTALPPICSSLEFKEVSWPEDYSSFDQVAFAVAMNITGSFEGHAGWTNISNNFDGQGVSLGILNQNLGSGTLQPLLIKMRDKHMSVLEKHLTDSMLNSLLGMLKSWEKDKALEFGVSSQEFDEDSRELILTEDDNIDKKYAFVGFQARSNSSSVNWAVKTLYTDSKGRNFKETWKTALKAIANEPEYVSQQIQAAQWRHMRAMGYKDRLGWKELRSYLLLFDFVVQNGSLKDKHFEKFEKWLANQDEPSEEEQMLEMLEIRVVDSHPKWQKDVRQRKTTIILGEGYVHGEDRNLPEEYCYDPMVEY